MEHTVNKFKVWTRESSIYPIYIKCISAIQPYRDDTFEATQIIDNLWLGDMRSPCNKKSIEDNNIDMIVSAVDGAMAYHPHTFRYEKAKLRDINGEIILPDIKRLLPKIKSKIDKGKGVLVHCVQGASRSATIVAAYLIKYKHMTSEEALKFMKSKRSCVNPNQGYRNQLVEYEQEINSEREEVGKKKKDN